MVGRGIARHLSDSVVTTTVDPYRLTTVKTFVDAGIPPGSAVPKHFCHRRH
jgi:hypothetical protein